MGFLDAVAACFGLTRDDPVKAPLVDANPNSPDSSKAKPQTGASFAHAAGQVAAVLRRNCPKLMFVSGLLGGNGVSGSGGSLWTHSNLAFSNKHLWRVVKSKFNPRAKVSPKTHNQQKKQINKAVEEAAKGVLENHCGVDPKTLGKDKSDGADPFSLGATEKLLFGQQGELTLKIKEMLNPDRWVRDYTKSTLTEAGVVTEQEGGKERKITIKDTKGAFKLFLGDSSRLPQRFQNEPKRERFIEACNCVITGKLSVNEAFGGGSNLPEKFAEGLLTVLNKFIEQEEGASGDDKLQDPSKSFKDLQNAKTEALNTLNDAKDVLDEALRKLSKKQLKAWRKNPYPPIQREPNPGEQDTNAKKDPIAKAQDAYREMADAQSAYKTASEAVKNRATSLQMDALYALRANVAQNSRGCKHAQAALMQACARVTNGHTRQAANLLNELTSASANRKNEGPLLALRSELAKTPDGFEALLSIEKLHGLGSLGVNDDNKDKYENTKIAYRTFLEAAGFLQQELPRRSGGSMDSLMKSAFDFGTNWTNLSIGANDDKRHQLAFQALLYSGRQLADRGFKSLIPGLNDLEYNHLYKLQNKDLQRTCRGGYIAWCNQFKTSGKGSDFDKAMTHMFKMRTLYRRATSHGDRTALNLLKDLGRQLRKTFFGQKKDPLIGLASRGHLGSAVHLRQQDMFENSEALLKGGGVSPGALYQTELLEGQIKGSGERTNEVDRENSLLGELKAKLGTVNNTKAEARLKVIQYWIKEGGRNLRVAADTEFTPVEGQKGKIETISADDLKRAFNRSFMTFRRNPKLHLRTLEKWACSAYGLEKGSWKKSIRELQSALPNAHLLNGTRKLPDEANQTTDLNFRLASPHLRNSFRGDYNRGHLFLIRVAKFRQLANGGRLAGKDCGNLFQMRDLKNILLRRKARQTVDKEMVREVWTQAFEGDEVIGSADSHAFGLDAGSVLNIGAGPLGSFGGAILNASKGKESFIQWGDGSHGSEAIWGEVTRTRIEGGIRGGLSIAKLDKFLKIGPFGGWSVAKETAKGSAFVTLIPQDRNPKDQAGKDKSELHSKYIATLFSEFMLDFASQEKGKETIRTKADLWARFSGDDKISNPYRVGVGLRKFDNANRSTRTELGLAVRVKWRDKYFGPMVSGSWATSKGTDKRGDKEGRFQVNRATQYNEVTGLVTGALSMGAETMYKGSGGLELNSRAIPGVGLAAQVSIKTSNGIVKLCMEGGRVIAPETNRDMVFSNAQDLMEHVNQDERKKVWLKSPTASGTYEPSYQAWSVKDKAFSQEEKGERALKAFIDDSSARCALGSNAYTTREVLHPMVADALTRLFGMAKVQEDLLARALDQGDQNHGRIDGLRASLHEINRQVVLLLEDQKSWVPKWMTVANTVSTASSFSWNTLVSFKNSAVASSRPKLYRLFVGSDDRDGIGYANAPKVEGMLESIAAAAA